MKMYKRDEVKSYYTVHNLHPICLLNCSEYEQSMQSLHDSLITCPPDDAHLYLIAYRLGHVRSAMEQTCVELSRTTTTTSPLIDVTFSPPFPVSTVVSTNKLPPVIVSNDVGGDTTSSTGNAAVSLSDDSQPLVGIRSDPTTTESSPSKPIILAVVAAPEVDDTEQQLRHRRLTDSPQFQRRAASASPAMFTRWSLTFIGLLTVCVVTGHLLVGVVAGLR